MAQTHHLSANNLLIFNLLTELRIQDGSAHCFQPVFIILPRGVLAQQRIFAEQAHRLIWGERMAKMSLKPDISEIIAEMIVMESRDLRSYVPEEGGVVAQIAFV